MRRALCVLVLVLGLAVPALAGPPWISIELPANPHDPATRGALFVVHAYHHGAGVQYPVTGTAEGLVGGERRSIPLTITVTDRAGIYAVARPHLDEGRWVLVIRLDTGNGNGATALVSLDGETQVAGVSVPSRADREGWTIPREVSAEEIDTMLRQGGLASSGLGIAAGIAASLFLPTARRRRGKPLP